MKARNTLGILAAHYHISHPEWDLVRCARKRDCQFTVPVPLAVHANTLLRAHYSSAHGAVGDLTPGTRLSGDEDAQTSAQPAECAAKQDPPSGKKTVTPPDASRKRSRDEAEDDDPGKTLHVATSWDDAAIFEMRKRMRNGTWEKDLEKDGHNAAEVLDAMKKVALNITSLANL